MGEISGRDFSSVGNTARAIDELSAKLRSKQVNFFDVLVALKQRLVPVSGEPHMVEDEETVKALGDLAEAMANSLRDTQDQALIDLMGEIGNKVSVGNLGADFFSNIKK